MMIFGVIAELPDINLGRLNKKKAMKKAKGYIVKWKASGKDIWSVHVYHLNKNITDSNKYASRAGRNLKANKLKAANKGYEFITRDNLKKLLKSNSKGK